MKQNRIAITTTTADKQTAAQTLATQLQADYIENPHSIQSMHYDYLLLYTPDYLGLQKVGEKKSDPFFIDFLSTKLRYRSEQAGMRRELIARAMGIRPREQLQVVDATAGTGRDSFILASVGFKVIMLERSPIMHALLEDALQRAAAQKAIAIQNIQLLLADAIEWLPQHPADVVYLDPMFPPRKKSSLVKKEMVILQDLLGKDEDTALLFNAAIACASKRVVVKRPRLAENLVAQEPSYTLKGKSSRFDIYLT